MLPGMRVAYMANMEESRVKLLCIAIAISHFFRLEVDYVRDSIRENYIYDDYDYIVS